VEKDNKNRLSIFGTYMRHTRKSDDVAEAGSHNTENEFVIAQPGELVRNAGEHILQQGKLQFPIYVLAHTQN